MIEVPNFLDPDDQLAVKMFLCGLDTTYIEYSIPKDDNMRQNRTDPVHIMLWPSYYLESELESKRLARDQLFPLVEGSHSHTVVRMHQLYQDIDTKFSIEHYGTPMVLHYCEHIETDYYNDDFDVPILPEHSLDDMLDREFESSFIKANPAFIPVLTGLITGIYCTIESQSVIDSFYEGAGVFGVTGILGTIAGYVLEKVAPKITGKNSTSK